MKTTILITLIGIFLFTVTACTVNVNQPNSNALPQNNNAASTPVNQKPWSVVVCSSRAKSVTLSAGSGENDGEVFATWQENSAQRKFDLPARVQNLSRIFLKGSASDKNQVEMCVLYDGKPKKRIEFDDDEDVIVNSGDVDDLDKCRCSQ